MSSTRTLSHGELVAVLLLHIMPFVGRPAIIGGDEPHYALMSHSIAVDGDIDLENNYLEVEAGSNAAGRKQAGSSLDRHLRPFGEREVFSHPLGLPLLTAPLIGLLQLVAPGAPPDLLLGLVGLGLTFLALLEGLRLLSLSMDDRRQATILGLLLYFSTPLWFYSRTFFTEPYVWSLLVLAVGRLERRRWLAASFLLGLALSMKETALLAVVPILCWAWRRLGKRRTLHLMVFPGLFVVLFCLKNRAVYGNWLVTFQPFQMGSPVEGAVGLLIDPVHGLAPFAPVSALALAGWFLLGRKQPSGEESSFYAMLAFLGYFVVSAAWVDWRGGSSYGPRLLVPVLPALAWPLMAVLTGERTRKWSWRALFALAIVGFTVQWCAVTSSFSAFWGIALPELLGQRPLATLSGLALALGAVAWLTHRPGAHHS